MIKVSCKCTKLIVKSLIVLTLTEISKTTILVGQKYIWNLRLPTSTSHHTLRHIPQSLVDWRNRGRRTRWKCQKPMLTFWLFFEIWLWTEILDQVLKPECCYPRIYKDSSNCGQKCNLGKTWVKRANVEIPQYWRLSTKWFQTNTYYPNQWSDTSTVLYDLQYVSLPKIGTSDWRCGEMSKLVWKCPLTISRPTAVSISQYRRIATPKISKN